jgi:hypothetical protein
MKSYLFCHMMPYSLVEVHWHFQGMYCFHLQGWIGSQAAHTVCHLFLVGYLSCFSTLKMETVHTPETSVNFHQPTKHPISEDSTFYKLYHLQHIYFLTKILFVRNPWFVL